MNFDLGALCQGAKIDFTSVDANDSSLDAIAKLHLGNSNDSNIPNLDFGSAWDFKKIKLNDEPSNSLDALAKLHLETQDSSASATPSFLLNPLSDIGLSFSCGNTAATSNFNPHPGEGKENEIQSMNFGDFKIPALFSSEEPKKNDKTGLEIDLTSALLHKTSIKSHSKPKSVKLKEENSYVKPFNILEEILLISEKVGSRKSPIGVSSRPSKAGLVVCRQWERKQLCAPVRKTSLSVAKITPFRFDTPSPDDVIKAAQSNLMHRHQK